MSINRDNYESWFLDYLDGTMDAGRKEKLMSFLEFNPELKTELDGMELLYLEAEKVNYQEKENLKKTDDISGTESGSGDFNTLCISAIENQISRDEKIALEELVKNDPEKRKSYILFQSTILEPDKTIIYPEKSKLKKRFMDIPRIRIAVYAAASAVILLALSGLFRNSQEPAFFSGNQEISRPGIENPVDKTTETITVEVRDPDPGNKIAEQPPILSEKSQGVQGELQSIAVVKSSGSVESQSDMMKGPSMSEEKMSGKQGDDSFIRLIALQPRQVEYLSHEEMIVPTIITNNFQDASYSRSEYLAEQVPERKKINLWKLADAGMQRINEISEEDYSLNRVVDEQGQTRRFTFESPIFGISTPMGNSNLPKE